MSGGGIDDLDESTGGPNFAAGSADDFDVTYETDGSGPGSGTLTQGETVTFTITGLNPNCFTSTTCAQNSTALPATAFAIRIINNPSGRDNTAISWASGASIDPVSAVPEPESYAMFLAGLGLLGFTARRKKLS